MTEIRTDTIATQQTQQAPAVGSLGNRSVTRGKSRFAAVKDALSTAFSHIGAKFRSLFSRRAQVGAAPTAKAAATQQTPAGQQGARLALEKAGTLQTNVKGTEKMFQYDDVTDTGITEQMVKDITRSDYTIGGIDVQRSPDRAVQALSDLVRDEDGKVDEKMLLAVSQIAHQGLLADGEKPLIMGLMNEHGVVPAGKKSGSGDSRYDIQRLDNGDIRVSASSHADVSFLVDNEGDVNELKDGSFYEYSFSVTINAENVARGQPTLTSTPVRYAYSLSE